MATRLGSADDQGKSFFAKSPIAAFNGALRHPSASPRHAPTILRRRYAGVVGACAVVPRRDGRGGAGGMRMSAPTGSEQRLETVQRFERLFGREFVGIDRRQRFLCGRRRRGEQAELLRRIERLRRHV